MGAGVCVFVCVCVVCSGAVDASKESFKHLLTCQDSGQALGLVVGGAAEALEAAPGRFLVKLEDRKGFIKMALKYGWVKSTPSKSSIGGICVKDTRKTHTHPSVMNPNMSPKR